MLIYKAVNKINNKCYVGQTTLPRLEDRLKSYKSEVYSKTNNRPFVLALVKYGFEGFDWYILHDNVSTVQELNKLEIMEIQNNNSLVENGQGYNVKYGGDNHKHCEETKYKIGIAQLGEKNHMFGIKGKDNHSSKGVINLYTKEIFDSVTLASEAHGASISKIAATCRGSRFSVEKPTKTIFRYLDINNRPIPVLTEKSSIGRSNIYLVNKDTIVMGTCPTISRHFKETNKFIRDLSSNINIEITSTKTGSTWRILSNPIEVESMLISVPSSSIILL